MRSSQKLRARAPQATPYVRAWRRPPTSGAAVPAAAMFLQCYCDERGQRVYTLKPPPPVPGWRRCASWSRPAAGPTRRSPARSRRPPPAPARRRRTAPRAPARRRRRRAVSAILAAGGIYRGGGGAWPRSPLPSGPAPPRPSPAPPAGPAPCDRNLALFEDELATRPRVPALLRRIAYSSLSPGSEDGQPPVRASGGRGGPRVPPVQGLEGAGGVRGVPRCPRGVPRAMGEDPGDGDGGCRG
ncbi:uncharacterized protein LOC110391520 [Numida meleagris]|uniref:uncharacterized protein LOC110391520 n=1 Tax=Numida meleagris TaxID=8996 RepID=UPI000B3DA828|nr:uncharacterized protein LOC110391520 [Numida meleagris]